MFTELSQWQHVSTEENPADLCSRGATLPGLARCSLWWNGLDWLTKDSSEWSNMLDLNRPSKIPEMETSKRKEGVNTFATLVMYSLQKEAAPKHKNTCEVWRLDPKPFSCWTFGSNTCKSEKSAAQPAQ